MVEGSRIVFKQFQYDVSEWKVNGYFMVFGYERFYFRNCFFNVRAIVDVDVLGGFVGIFVEGDDVVEDMVDYLLDLDDNQLMLEAEENLTKLVYRPEGLAGELFLGLPAELACKVGLAYYQGTWLPFRTSTRGLPVAASWRTSSFWLAERLRSFRFPGVSQYVFSPTQATITLAK